jgi:hypothetical protein
LELEGLKLLAKARDLTGAIVTEVMQGDRCGLVAGVRMFFRLAPATCRTCAAQTLASAAARSS